MECITARLHYLQLLGKCRNELCDKVMDAQKCANACLRDEGILACRVVSFLIRYL